jgi:hypothetical protein
MATNSIKVTRDYSKFKMVAGNRPVTDSTIRVKVREMRRKNLLPDQPILVKQNGDGRMMILDGQNRFEAAKILGLPIHYKLATVADAADIAPMNSAQRAWKPRDYLHHYTESGSKDYETLSNFVRDTGLPLSVAIDLLSGGSDFSSASKKPSFRNGEFKVANPDLARSVADLVSVVKEWVGWATDRSLVLAIFRIVQSTNAFTPKRLATKLQYQSRSLVKCANWLQYVELLDEIYNNRVKASDVVMLREAVRRHAAEQDRKATSSNKRQ